MNGFESFKSENDIKSFHRASLKAGDFELSAYHPLGTARMGTSPQHSVVGPDHQSHDIPGLYIVDGSSLPSSIGVNPQLTIMAMASRAADRIDERI